MRMTIASVGGTKTRYYHGGSGKPLMLVHGVGMSADTWFPAIPQLERHFSVCAPDLLDNGFTEAGPFKGGPPQPYMLDHLLALADHMGYPKFSLVGSSLGALLVSLLYLREPERVDRLVLLGPGAVIETPESLATVFDAAHKNGRSALDNPTYESCRARMGRAVYDAASVPDSLIVMQMCLYALPGAAEKFERRMSGLKTEQSLREYTIYDRLARVKAPVLAIIGRNDPRGSYEHTVSGAKRLPNVQILTYDNCGHWPHVEYPERFARDVVTFLGGSN